MVMKFSKATPNWVSLWSPSDKSHMNVYSVHPLYKLCFLLKLFLLFSFSAKHCASHCHIIVFSMDRQQFARLRCQWISVERCCTLCKQACFRNGLLPHPLPQLKRDVCQKKTMSCFGSNMSTSWTTMELTTCYPCKHGFISTCVFMTVTRSGLVVISWNCPVIWTQMLKEQMRKTMWNWAVHQSVGEEF